MPPVTCDQSPADVKPGSSLASVPGWRTRVRGRSRACAERILLLMLPRAGRAVPVWVFLTASLHFQPSLHWLGNLDTQRFSKQERGSCACC